jgi:hypothetical protein
MWQKDVSFGHAQLMGGGSERASDLEMRSRDARMASDFLCEWVH